MRQELRIDVGVVQRSGLRSMQRQRAPLRPVSGSMPARNLRTKSTTSATNAARLWLIDASIPRSPRGYHQPDGCPYRCTSCPVGGGLSSPRARKAQGPSLSSASGICGAAWPAGGRQHSREKYARTHSDSPAERAMPRTDEGGSCDRAPRSDLPIG